VILNVHKKMYSRKYFIISCCGLCLNYLEKIKVFKVLSESPAQGRKKEFSSWEHNLETKISCRRSIFVLNLHVHKHIVF
jgi:hypothetical protein